MGHWAMQLRSRAGLSIVICYLAAVVAAIVHSSDWSLLQRMAVTVGIVLLAHLTSVVPRWLRTKDSRLRRDGPTLEEARAAADRRAVAAGQSSRVNEDELSPCTRQV